MTDPDAGQTVTLAITAGPANGTATVAAGRLVHLHADRHASPATTRSRSRAATTHCFQACATGTVTVAVYPVAVDDAQRHQSRATTVEVDVQANDIGDAGARPDRRRHRPTGRPSIGSIIYTPDAGFSGTDQVDLPRLQPERPDTLRRRDARR